MLWACARCGEPIAPGSQWDLGHRDGTLSYADQRSTARGVERAIEAAGLDGQGISSHTFRHTYASLFIVGLKLDPVVVAGQLGHANPR